MHRYVPHTVYAHVCLLYRVDVQLCMERTAMFRAQFMHSYACNTGLMHSYVRYAQLCLAHSLCAALFRTELLDSYMFSVQS